ncbi:MAG TPA: SDR family NAD-dependent epimerase/dehydratase, partial [Acetobacteraceae bacterium]
LAERVIRLTGSASQIIHRPLPQDDPMQRCPDITKARDVLGWQPSIALDQGLQQTVEYFRGMLAESQERADHVVGA